VIEPLKDFPDNVMGVYALWHLTKADYETVLRPQIEDKLRTPLLCQDLTTSLLIRPVVSR